MSAAPSLFTAEANYATRGRCTGRSSGSNRAGFAGGAGRPFHAARAARRHGGRIAQSPLVTTAQHNVDIAIHQVKSPKARSIRS